MTTDPAPDDRVLALLADYLRPDWPVEKVAALIATFLRALDADPAASFDVADITALGEALLAAQDDGEVMAAQAALTAAVAVAYLRGQVVKATGTAPAPTSDRWIRRNVTAASRHAPRVKALWRVPVGLAETYDTEAHDHAVKSALSGATVQPVPKPPVGTPDPGTEDPMPDNIALRNTILAEMTFDPTGLPTALRRPENQNVYIDAVMQGVIRQQGFADGDDEAIVLWTASAAALLLADGHYDPRDRRFYAHLQRVVVELAGSAVEMTKVQIDGHAIDMFAPDDATQRVLIFRQVSQLLKAGGAKSLFLQSFGRVGRKMADRFDDHRGNATILGTMAATAYGNDVADIGGNGGGAGGGGIANMDLPPLHDPQGTADEIEPDNIRAVSTIYATYQLEFALKAMGRLLDLFVAGLLPIPASDASARELDTLYWDQDDLLDEGSRRSVYARVLGAPGGAIAFDIQPNTEFNTLLMRVVSAVSEYEREQSALTHFDNASRGRRFQSTSGEFVRKAIRDFAANASLRGWAGTAFVAERMARHVKKAFRILGLPAVRNAYGVQTPWQVVERISQREFGISVNTVLNRTLAVETQNIMGLIAERHSVWSSSDLPLFPELARGGGLAASDLSEAETRKLMVACQHFRAVTGVGDTMLAEYSTPVETQPTPSLPAMSGSGGPPGIDMTGITQLRQMVASGQTPSLDQINALLPGF
ncbi:MAG: hypothetical protein ACT4OK_04760 [Gemmobacter sp.]